MHSVRPAGKRRAGRGGETFHWSAAICRLLFFKPRLRGSRISQPSRSPNWHRLCKRGTRWWNQGNRRISCYYSCSLIVRGASLLTEWVNMMCSLNILSAVSRQKMALPFLQSCVWWTMCAFLPPKCWMGFRIFFSQPFNPQVQHQSSAFHDLRKRVCASWSWRHTGHKTHRIHPWSCVNWIREETFLAEVSKPGGVHKFHHCHQ